MKKDEIIKSLNLNYKHILDLELFKTGPITFFIWKNDGTWEVEYVSQNIINILGFNPEQFYDKEVNYYDLINDLDITRVLEEIQHSKEQKIPYIDHQPYRLRNANNEFIWVRDFTNIIRNSEGKVDRLLGFVFDISSDKNNEEKLVNMLNDFEWKNWELETLQRELKDSEERFKTFANFTMDWEYWINNANEFQFISPSCEIITGYKPIEFMENPDLIVEIIDESYKSKMKSHIESSYNQINNNNCELELLIVTKTGEKKYLQHICRPIFDTDGEYLGRRISNRDITEKKLAQEKIHTLSQSIEQTSSSIVITDTDGTIQYVNKTFSDLTGFSADEAIGKKPSILNSGKHSKEFFADLWNNINSGKDWKGEFLNKKKNGELYWEKASISPIFNSDNQITQFLAVKEDITEQKIMEESREKLILELQESKQTIEENLMQKNQLILELTQIKEELEHANSEKDKFFSIIAHDLKSPFSGFLNLTKMMADDVMDFTMRDLVGFTRSLQESADGLYKLLENLLEWSRMKRGVTSFEPELNNLRMLVQSNLYIIQQTAANKGITLVNEVPDDIAVFADVPMINTVFRNFISNAVKFTPKNGKITISAEKRDREVFISVQDTGIGMSEEILGKLFKVDQKVSRPGTEGESSTGLGLLLCKEFIEKHNGRIWVESEVNKGSKFNFVLPEIFI